MKDAALWARPSWVNYKADEANFSPSMSPLRTLIPILCTVRFNIKKKDKLQHFWDDVLFVKSESLPKIEAVSGISVRSQQDSNLEHWLWGLLSHCFLSFVGKWQDRGLRTVEKATRLGHPVRFSSEQKGSLGAKRRQQICAKNHLENYFLLNLNDGHI